MEEPTPLKAVSAPASTPRLASLTVKNVDSWKVGSVTRSHTVINGYFSFRLLVFPHGTKSSSGLYLSAFVEAAPVVKLIPEWCFKDVSYTVTLVNHCDPNWNVVKSDVFSFAHDHIDRGWHDVCSIKDLMDVHQGWLGPDNSVLITGTATVDLSEESWLAMKSPLPDVQVRFSSDLSSLLSSGWRADVQLGVDGDVINVHSFILAARSPVFKQMLHSGMQESEAHAIDITDVDRDTLNHLCIFMYSGTISDLIWESEDNIAALIYAASKYEVLSLVELCADKVVRLASTDNAARWLRVSAQISMESMKAYYINFVANHLSEVQTTAGWESLMQDKELVFIVAPRLFQTISSVDSSEEVLPPRCVQTDVQARFVSDLSSLLSSGWRADVQLEVDGQVINVHSVIIAARSPVFKRMLDSGMKESNARTIVVTDVDWDTVNHLCNFMYSTNIENSIWDSEDNITALMYAASKYEVLSLVKLCEDKVVERVSSDNAAHWLRVSAQLDIESLEAYCMDVVVKHLAQVQTTAGWECLMKDKQLVFDLAPRLFQAISPPSKDKQEQSK